MTTTFIALLLVFSGLAPAQHDALVIADFDGDKAETRSGLSLWLYCDEQFGGTSEAHATLIHPGAETSRGALRPPMRPAM